MGYQFTFNLSKKEDRHYTQINFRLSPIKAGEDVNFFVNCSVMAKMNITVKTANDTNEKPLYMGQRCSMFKAVFSNSDFNFGNDNNVNGTFYVNVYDFKPPLIIQIEFFQPPKLKLQQFISLLAS